MLILHVGTLVLSQVVFCLLRAMAAIKNGSPVFVVTTIEKRYLILIRFPPVFTRFRSPFCFEDQLQEVNHRPVTLLRIAQQVHSKGSVIWKLHETWAEVSMMWQ